MAGLGARKQGELASQKGSHSEHLKESRRDVSSGQIQVLNNLMSLGETALQVKNNRAQPAFLRASAIPSVP